MQRTQIGSGRFFLSDFYRFKLKRFFIFIFKGEFEVNQDLKSTLNCTSRMLIFWSF